MTFTAGFASLRASSPQCLADEPARSTRTGCRREQHHPCRFRFHHAHDRGADNRRDPGFCLVVSRLEPARPLSAGFRVLWACRDGRWSIPALTIILLGGVAWGRAKREPGIPW